MVDSSKWSDQAGLGPAGKGVSIISLGRRGAIHRTCPQGAGKKRRRGGDGVRRNRAADTARKVEICTAHRLTKRWASAEASSSTPTSSLSSTGIRNDNYAVDFIATRIINAAAACHVSGGVSNGQFRATNRKRAGSLGVLYHAIGRHGHGHVNAGGLPVTMTSTPSCASAWRT